MRSRDFNLQGRGHQPWSSNIASRVGCRRVRFACGASVSGSGARLFFCVQMDGLRLGVSGARLAATRGIAIGSGLSISMPVGTGCAAGMGGSNGTDLVRFGFAAEERHAVGIGIPQGINGGGTPGTTQSGTSGKGC